MSNLSFYQYIKTQVALFVSEKQQVINAISEDIVFPKHSQDYNEITNYLEDNAYYIDNMDIFDELWNEYLEMRG